MRILYCHLYDPHSGPGGADRGVYDLAISMKERFHEEVTALVNPGGLADKLRVRGILVAEIPRSKFRIFEMLNVLHRTLNNFRPQIVHSNHRYTTFLMDLFFKNRCRILHTQRVLTHDKRLLFRYGHLVTTVHESVRENLIRHYGVPKAKAITIVNAVPPPVPNPDKIEKLSQRYPRREGEVYVLCAARLDEQKGHPYLIEAMAQLPPSHRKRIRIFLAGDGPLASRLQEEVRKRGLSESLIFLGYTEDIPEWLALCDFFVLPSLWEGLPRVLLEAYSVGKPVIATDIPGSRESVQANETGLLVPPRDGAALSRAILWMADHPQEVLRMKKKAYQFWQENFSFEKMVSSYHKLYEDLISQ